MNQKDQNFVINIYRVFGPLLLGPFFRKERNLINKINEEEGSVQSLPTSPERFEFEARPEASRMGFPVLRLSSIIHHNKRSYTHALKKNPKQPKIEIEEQLLREFEGKAKQLGVDVIGYTKLQRELIFKDKAVLYDSAIVLIREMDFDKIEKAPSHETLVMILETYDTLGIIANRLSDFLRKNGYGAQASHAVFGPALYPPLAKAAGLGWQGRHGLLISPEFGPRFRIGAIYTSITNLPFPNINEHEWIADYCESCGICVASCPPKAIYEKPILKGHKRKKYIDSEKCFKYFASNEACSICIKICPFHKRSYSEINRIFFNKK